jgi:pimeloyl-ACP methyl ester carboxylesterase
VSWTSENASPATATFSVVDPATPVPPTAAPAPAAPPAISPPAWGACPSGFTSECATLSVPLEHAAPDGETIDLFVAHRPAVTPGGPALWLLEGGPGGSGADLVDVIELLAKRNPSFDIYTLDHRGVGHSTALECAAEESALADDDSAATAAAWDACIMHLESTHRLRGFNVTEAAHDLSHAIRATRHEAQDVVVYGVSYGTYWLNRYLQLYPDEPNAAIMDSTLVPELMIGPNADQQADRIAKECFDTCGKDPFCASKLGPDPWTTLGRVYDGLRHGHCPALGLTPKTLRGTMGALFDDRDTHVLLLAMLHRVDRCTDADVAAVGRFYDRIFEKPLYNGYSSELEHHVLLSEFWPPTSATVAELRDATEHVYIGGDYGPLGAKLFPKWPRYVTDDLAHRWHASPRPVLLLAGTLDVRTLVIVA